MKLLLTGGISNRSIHDALVDLLGKANAEKWAAGVAVPAYAIDDQTAIKVTDGAVEVVFEGHWQLFTPS